MKRKIASRKKTIHRTKSSSAPTVFSFNRVIIITACVVLLVTVLVIPNKSQVTRTVAGASIFKPLYAQTTISLPHTTGAAFYNVYYKPVSDAEFIHALRNISGNSRTVTISYLKKKTDYVYMVSAVDSSGKEFWFSPITPITTLQSM